MSEAAVLTDKFGQNNPFSFGEIMEVFPQYSKPNVVKIVNRLMKNEEICKADTNIYYIPTKTMLGKSSLSLNKIREKRYLTDGKNTIGFLSGLSFENAIGLTTQVPNVVEITTNNASMRVRDVEFCGRKTKIRKSRVKINNENWKELQMLEYLTSVSAANLEKDVDFLKGYIQKENLDIQKMFKLAQEFPSKTSKNLIKMGVV